MYNALGAAQGHSNTRTGGTVPAAVSWLLLYLEAAAIHGGWCCITWQTPHLLPTHPASHFCYHPAAAPLSLSLCHHHHSDHRKPYTSAPSFITLSLSHTLSHTLHRLTQTSEREMARKELLGADQSHLTDASEDVIYKIDIPANRYDMLCLEGIARALNIFKGRMPAPKYRLADMRGEQWQQWRLAALVAAVTAGLPGITGSSGGCGLCGGTAGSNAAGWLAVGFTGLSAMACNDANCSNCVG